MGGRGKTDLDNYENAVLEMPPRSNSVMNLMDNNNLNASIQHQLEDVGELSDDNDEKDQLDQEIRDFVKQS